MGKLTISEVRQFPSAYKFSTSLFANSYVLRLLINEEVVIEDVTEMGRKLNDLN